jgi:hypothetical protein
MGQSTYPTTIISNEHKSSKPPLHTQNVPIIYDTTVYFADENPLNQHPNYSTVGGENEILSNFSRRGEHSIQPNSLATTQQYSPQLVDPSTTQIQEGVQIKTESNTATSSSTGGAPNNPKHNSRPNPKRSHKTKDKDSYDPNSSSSDGEDDFSTKQNKKKSIREKDKK